MTLIQVLLRPPLQHDRKWLRGLLYTVVELGSKIVQPSLSQPVTGIGIEIFISIKSCSVFRVTGTPDSEWADPELYIRLDLLDPHGEFADRLVYILPSPVCSGKLISIFLCSFPTLPVREISTVCIGGIRIEVVINISTVYFLAFIDTPYLLYCLLPRLFLPGILP